MLKDAFPLSSLMNVMHKFNFFTGIVIMVFLAYLGGAIWGCTMVKEGLERRRLSRYDSYSVSFYDMEDEYFRDYPYRIQVRINNYCYGHLIF